MTTASNALEGRTALVTGANTGMGKVTAKALAGLGATVLLGCRNPERGEAARADIVGATGNSRVSVLAVDLASQSSVREAATRVTASAPKLDILVNNAGGWWHDRRVSPDGIELQWATNVLGPHFLTLALLPVLEASGRGRIVNVASTAAGGLNLDDVESSKKKYNGVSVYSTTKQANRMLTWALARRLRGKAVVANSLSPGLVKTELNRNAAGFFGVVFSILGLFARTAERGADTAIWLASSSEIDGLSDTFFIDRKQVPCKFRDPAAEDRLWDVCEQQRRA